MACVINGGCPDRHCASYYNDCVFTLVCKLPYIERMALNTRFATGVHIVMLLSEQKTTFTSSADLANELGTNPVVVRRVMSLLSQAGMIHSQRGPQGGCRLAKPAKSISLADVYKAVEHNPLFFVPEVPTKDLQEVNEALVTTFKKARTCVFEEFAQISITEFRKLPSKRLKHKR